jgi:uncharacterized zinc-type alcohol dehydrogenase-like protein
VLCMATADGRCDFKPGRFWRRPLGDHDILIDMKYCGICHTDLHFAAGHLAALGGTKYPCVPGHELAGVAAAVGSRVTRVAVGDAVGVGCMVDSCGTCGACRRGEEQKCIKQVATYNGKDRSGRAATHPAGGHTLGGYTSRFVVHERFAIRVPSGYPLQFAGPVMCAGITLFDPMHRYGVRAGSRVAIVGIGGLGQMGVKIGKAMGARVTAITRSAAKAAYARERCGADATLVSTDEAAMAAAAGSFDIILNTIPVEHDWTVYTPLLAPRPRRGMQVMLGLTTGFIAGMAVDTVVCGASSLKGSGIGGIEATQAVMDLCATHKIYPDVRVIPVEAINSAFEALESANESGERFVIDLAGSLNEAAFDRCSAVAPPKFGPPPPVMTVGSILRAIVGTLCCCRWR